MASTRKNAIRHAVLRPIPYLFTDRAGVFLTRSRSGDLIRILSGRFADELTDSFVDFLLSCMGLAFDLIKDYRKRNIEGDRAKRVNDFEGRYLFRTKDKRVTSSVIFSKGRMESLRNEAIDDWDVRITFESGGALRSFIFSEDQDILNCILDNTVSVDGNLNYLYKFGFMARDLAARLGIG